MNKTNKRILFWVSLSTFTLYGFPLMAGLFGWVRFSENLNFSFAPILNLLIFTAILHAVLVFPIMMAVWPVIEKKKWEITKLAVLTLYFLLPLISYSYYVGKGKNILGASEYFHTVLPQTVLALTLFLRFHLKRILTVFLSFSVYTSLYLFNDLLSPFKAVFYYEVVNSSFYFYRTLWVLVGIAFIFHFCPMTNKKMEEELEFQNA